MFIFDVVYEYAIYFVSRFRRSGCFLLHMVPGGLGAHRLFHTVFHVFSEGHEKRKVLETFISITLRQRAIDFSYLVRVYPRHIASPRTP